MIEIPVETDGSAYVSLSCNLGKLSVSFRLLWNERDGAWFCDFESVKGKNNGVRLIPDSYLLRSNKRAIENGDFAILKKQTSIDENLDFDNFGTVYGFYFIEDEEKPYFEGLL